MVAGGSLIDFESTTSGQYTNITIGGVTFSSPNNGAPFDIDGDFAGSFNSRGNQSLSNDFDFQPSQLRFDFASTVTAFAFNWVASDEIWQMDVYDANGLIESHVLSVVTGSNAGDYFGAVNAGTDYVILTNQGSGDYIFFDNLIFTGDARQIPEPSTLAVLALGLLGFYSARKRS